MKNLTKKILALVCGVLFLIPAFAACDGEQGNVNDGDGDTQKIDYVDGLKLDLDSETKKLKVKVYSFIDGDTTHFRPDESTSDDFAGGYIKARYLAVNTPESTGKVEEWGKSASNFTHEKLEKTESIIIESDDDKWNVDSTGERYLLWIWYVPAGEEVKAENYRNLNVELLQEGYGRASKTGDNRYGETASAALAQAQSLGYHIYGKEADPNYFGKAATPLGSIKYLRFHIDDYIQRPVSVSGVVTACFANSVYIEEYDEELDCRFGIAVFFGYDLGEIIDILSVGNEVNVVGTLTEFNGTYQISDVKYNAVRPNDPSNSQIITPKEEVDYTPFSKASAADYAMNSQRKVTATFESEDEDGEITTETLTKPFNEVTMDTSVKFENLTITHLYTTKNEDSASKGAMTITCRDASGVEIDFRTQVLYKPDGSLYTVDDIGKVGDKIVSICGIVDYYVPKDSNTGELRTEDAQYQIAVWDYSNFVFA